MTVPYSTVPYGTVCDRILKKYFRYIVRSIYRYFLPRYMDRHNKRYFFGNEKYTVTPTVTVTFLSVTANVTAKVMLKVTVPVTRH